MKKCIVISDSFKGSLSSVEICRIANDLIPQVFPECRVLAIPAADGGEGTVDSFVEALGACSVSAMVNNAYGEQCTAVYARLGDTAIIEMAAAAGLPSVGSRKDPSITTTYGVGELILHAVNSGCQDILLGLGGSATNDGGCGCAAALGVKFINSKGESFVPVGATLKDICGVETQAAAEKLKNVTITVMSDVENPLYGEKGAAYVFGPQKGADKAMVLMLDAGLRHLSERIEHCLGIDVSNIAGGGAAGGMGSGTVAFLGGKIQSGIETILELTDFDRQLEDTDLVITGEGRLDSQSFQGKVISGVAARCRAKQKALIAVVGCTGEGAEEASSQGISAVFTTNRAGLPFEQLKLRTAADYRETLLNILRLIRAFA